MSTRYSLGERGSVNLIGLYQSEQSAFTRPALGFEASANLIGGANTELHFKPAWVTRLLNKLSSQASTAPSTNEAVQLSKYTGRPAASDAASGAAVSGSAA